MNAIRNRFLLSCALAAILAVTLGVSHNGEISSKVAEFTTPIETATQAVVDSAKCAGGFASYLPGNYK